MTSKEGDPKYGSGDAKLSGDVTIPNLKGLHARASAEFVKCAEKFAADVRVSHEGQTVLGTSIMGLMMLAAGKGSTLRIETRGPQARQALEALRALVGAGFHEED